LQWATGEGARLSNEEPATFWEERVHRYVGRILRYHGEVHSEIAAKLMSNGSLKGLALSGLSDRIKRRRRAPHPN